jgi:uncharacterized protein YybS (DUF2232 family)
MDLQWSFPPEYMHTTKNNVHRLTQILAGRDYTTATMTAIRDYGMHPGMMVMPGMIVMIGVLSAYIYVCGGCNRGRCGRDVGGCGGCVSII